MVDINPIQLYGNWDLGYALDVHTLNSILIGEDAFGHPRFESTRSDIGELLFQFKYRYRYDALDEIADTVCSFLANHPEMTQVDTIIPVPPTKHRDYQPTYEIADEVAKRLHVYCCINVLENNSSIEAKSLSYEDKHKSQQGIVKVRNATRKHSTLLIDDLFQSGATLSRCVDLLRTDPLIDKIYVLTITKTKNS